MKRRNIINIISAIAIAAGAFACKKSDSSDRGEKKVSQELASLPNGYVQRLAYETITAAEEFSLWNEHLNWACANLTLSQQQLSKINEVRALLTVEFFEQSGATNEFEIWKATASEVFNQKQLYLLFHQPSQFDVNQFYNNEKLPGVVDGGGGSGGGAPSCHCSQTANFCNLQVEAGDPGMFSCDAKDCKKSSKGCGWFWQNPCNGLCVYHVFSSTGGGSSTGTNN